MEIDAHMLSVISYTNPGDYAVYRVENGTLRALLCSGSLPALSGMTLEEYNAVTEKDAAAVVLESDRKLVAAKLTEVLENADDSAVFTLTYRILHKTKEFVWVRAKACLIGESGGEPVLLVSFATISAASEEYANLLDHTGTSIYVIDKGTYELLYVNETAKQASGNQSYQSIECFRYFNGLESPCPWCSLPMMKDGYAHISENYVSPLNRWYRHDVQDINWYGHNAAAFYVTNITEQKQRQKLDEERFGNLYRQVAAANPNALAIFRLNLTKNICSDVQSQYETARRQQNTGTVDGYLAACAEIISDDDIRKDCMKRFTLPNLLKEYQNGVTEMSVEYPIRSSGGDTVWVDGIITMMQNSVSGDIEGIAYALNVTDRKVNESILARLAEEKYDHIGLINPSLNSYEMWKKDGSYGLDPRQRVDYNAVFQDILAHYIFPEDRELFADHGKLSNIAARLDRDGTDTFVYRCRSNTGECLYKQVKYVWLDARHDLIMESQTDLTALYEQQIEHVRRQHEAELAKERAFSAESIPSGIGVFDYEDGKLSLNYMNNGFYQMLGAVKEEYARMVGTDILNAVFEEDRTAILQEAAASISGKRQFFCRFRLTDGNGCLRWVEVAANHIPQSSTTERFYAAYYDVDKLVRTQTELQEKELVFRDILSYSDILHFTYYPHLHRYSAEIMPERLSEIPKTMDQYPESFIRYIGLNADDAKSYHEMVHAIDMGASEAECTVLMNYNGKSGWYRVHLMSVSDENGQTVKAIGNVFNVNRTVEAEKAIADEKLRVESLRGVYLATASYNVTKDTETTFNAGGSLSRSVEIDEDELAEARKIEPKIDRQRRETLSTLLSAAKQIPDGKQRYEFIRCCSHEGMMRLFSSGNRDVLLEYRRILDGELVWVSTRIILMAEPSTGDILAFYYTRDISEQKKGEQITRLTLEKNCDYAALLNVKKRTLKFRSMSDEKEIRRDGWELGAENDYDRNTRIAVNSFLFKEDIEKVSEQVTIENIVSNLEKTDEYSVTFDRRALDGKIHRKQVQYHWMDETRTEILVVQTDITEAYIQEQERTRQLHEALTAAKRANDAKTEFISRISHDIRTPISAITNMTAFAREDVDDRDRLLHDLDRIESSNTFLLSLINDVLDISKIDSGMIELHPEPYPYEEYIEGIRSIFEPLCKQNGQTFRIIGGKAAKGKGVLVDRVRYSQISLNLLSNAVKYTPAGGTVTYASHAGKRSDGMIECGFDISDNGIGMSSQFQKTMFEPFTQEFDNEERKKLSTGTGLGLSIVKRLVDLMGGTIEVKSELGKGTRVAVRFVLPEAAVKEQEAGGYDEDGSSKTAMLSGKVLLAEDNVINTEIAVRILESLGLQVDHAENGQQAVELFLASPQNQYLAVLMDIQMPVMNGYDAARLIRAAERPDAKHVPVIAMTADAFEESVREAENAGMDDYVTKPVEPRKLSETLRKYAVRDFSFENSTVSEDADEGRDE